MKIIKTIMFCILSFLVLSILAIIILFNNTSIEKKKRAFKEKYG
jgi:hypothetical protein